MVSFTIFHKIAFTCLPTILLYTENPTKISQSNLTGKRCIRLFEYAVQLTVLLIMFVYLYMANVIYPVYRWLDVPLTLCLCVHCALLSRISYTFVKYTHFVDRKRKKNVCYASSTLGYYTTIMRCSFRLDATIFMWTFLYIR